MPLANISRCIDAHTLAKIRQKGSSPTHPYRDVISDLFAVGRRKKEARSGNGDSLVGKFAVSFVRRHLNRRMHLRENILTGMYIVKCERTSCNLVPHQPHKTTTNNLLICSDNILDFQVSFTKIFGYAITALDCKLGQHSPQRGRRVNRDPRRISRATIEGGIYLTYTETVRNARRSRAGEETVAGASAKGGG